MTDVVLDINGDIDFGANGDLKYGYSNLQHQRDILLCRPGDYKTALPIGVGINDYEKDDDANDMLSSIKQNFNKDGMTVKLLNYDQSATKLYINAPYDADSNS